jgi:transposase InsO family protein
MDKSIVVSALEKAFIIQSNPEYVIIHTDRGNQYLSKDYIDLVNYSNCIRSYSD